MMAEPKRKKTRSFAFWQRKPVPPAVGAPQKLAVSTANGDPLFTLNPEGVGKFRQLHNRLGRENGLPQKIGLTSALRGEGVTTIAISLGAVMAADLEAKTCIVELNWWWPKLAQLAKIPEQPGLAQVMCGVPLDEALIATNLMNLHLLAAGTITDEEPTRLAHSQRLGEQLHLLSEQFDHLILDIPAVLAVGDSLALAAHADEIGLVVRAGVTPTTQVQRALEDIHHLPVKWSVLNGENIALPDWLYRILPEG